MHVLESLPTVIGTAAVAPALLILWLVIAAGERPGPPAKVWTAFLLGAASISLLGVVRAPFAAMSAASENPWVAQALHSLFGVAYLAIARSGTALGAHRHHRDWARISSLVLVLLAPIALHAGFDFPLLTLQRNPDIDPSSRLMLGSVSVLIGFSAIGFAIRLVRRVGHHHAPRTEIARERLNQLRRMWALLVVGGGAGFAGLAFVLSSIHHWLLNPDRNMALVLVPVGLVSILIGTALLVVTTAIYVLGRNRIRTTPQGISSAPGPG